MNILEHVSLAPFTTLGVGGAARFFAEAHTEEEVQEAIVFSLRRELPLLALGKGSNVLVPDAGIEAVVLRIAVRDIVVKEDGEDVLLAAGAGASWEDIVQEVGIRGIFGIENLAGIPGSLGGAAVQNIGAYGAEIADVFEYADTIDRTTGTKKRVFRDEAAFAYRNSLFKRRYEYIILRVALRLSGRAASNIAYADLICAGEDGIPLTTPIEIAYAVRTVRARKFPQDSEEGTAGSFFKNPVISRELYEDLARRFPGLPAFPQEDGVVKISLAWILDHALSLKGFSIGAARLYEKQPLVIVTRTGACASDVDALATEVERRVLAATNIKIEREVETFALHARLA